MKIKKPKPMRTKSPGLEKISKREIVDINSEPDMEDPTLVCDMRLSRTEWMIYWKTKYNNSLDRIVRADGVIKKLKQTVREIHAEYKKVEAENVQIKDDLNSRIMEIDTLRAQLSMRTRKKKVTKKK